MYRINPLDRNVLITTDEVIKKLPSNQELDPRILQNSIEVAEERFIVDIICNDLYEDFIFQKNKVVTDSNRADLQTKVNEGNNGTLITLQNGMIINALENVSDPFYKQLWTRFLWRITAECVWYVSMPSNWLRSTAQGEMHNAPAVVMSGQGAASTDLPGMKWKMDKVFMDRIDPLTEKMKKWLFTNKDHLSKYNCITCLEDIEGNANVPGGVSYLRKSPFVFGIYDDDPDECCDSGVQLLTPAPVTAVSNKTTLFYDSVSTVTIPWTPDLATKHGNNPIVQVYWESSPGVYDLLTGGLDGSVTLTGNPLAQIFIDLVGTRSGYIIIE